MKAGSHILLILYFLARTALAAGQATAITPATVIPDTLALDSLYEVALHFLQEDNLQQSREKADELLRMSDRSDYRRGRAGAYYLTGRMKEKEGDPAEALRAYFMAVKEYEWEDDRGKLAEVYVRMGDIYRTGELYSKAVEYYSRAGKMLDEDKEIDGLIVKEHLAEVYYLLRNYDSALILYRELLAAYEDSRPESALITLYQVTSCLYNLGRYEDALSYNQYALELSRSASLGKMREVQALNSLGYNYNHLKDYHRAEQAFGEAALIAGDQFPGEELYPVTLVNLAIARQNLGDVAASLATFSDAVRAARGNLQEKARILHLISYVYLLEKDYYNAGIYNQQAMEAAGAAGSEELLLQVYQVASLISTSLYDYETGMAYYRQYLSLRDSLATKKNLAGQRLAAQEYTVERTEKELERVLYHRELQGLEMKNLRIEGEKKQQELELLRKTSELQAVALVNQELEKDKALQELLLAEERLAAERKDREIQDLRVEQQLQESELKRKELEQIRQNQEIEVLTKDKELNELTIRKIRARNAFLAGIVLLSIAVLILLFRGLRYARKTNRLLNEQSHKIQQQKEAIESQYEIIKVEQQKSDRLLLNILPEETARELKEKGRAAPRQYRKVSVLFTDFVGFTMVAEKLTPEQLVQELDTCFLEFDRIIGLHDLEKIKTIGDSYMCAGGIPAENDSNPFDAVEAALEIKEFMDRTWEERKREGREYWQLRIGIHTGEVVAGVVGNKKFAYDIWGDAVNTASRMESSGEPGRVNISGSTYELVKDHYECSHRGKVYAKNKGEIDMYFVNGKIRANPAGAGKDISPQ